MKCNGCGADVSEQHEVCSVCGREIATPLIDENSNTEVDCLRCGNMMEALGTRKIQLGKHGFFLGDLSHLLSGALEVEIFRCTRCRKIELFSPETEEY